MWAVFCSNAMLWQRAFMAFTIQTGASVWRHLIFREHLVSTCPYFSKQILPINHCALSLFEWRMVSVHSQNNKRWIKQPFTFKSASVFKKLNWIELLRFSVTLTRLKCLHSGLLSDPMCAWETCQGSKSSDIRKFHSRNSSIEFHNRNSSGSRREINSRHSNTSCLIFCKDPQRSFIVGDVVCLKKCMVFPQTDI